MSNTEQDIQEQAKILRDALKGSSIDFAKVEKRIASFQGIPEGDIWVQRASQFFGVPEDSITSEQRRAMKNVYFVTDFGAYSASLDESLEEHR